MLDQNKTLVTIKNETVVTDSRMAASYFGKRHDNVLTDIDDLIEEGVFEF